ncbi:MAG: response regulator [Acidobacteriia bacterium]|nr:response regulator [Terriglobia bacterium]
MSSSSLADLAPRRRAIYFATIVLLAIAYALLQLDGWHGSAYLHTLMELAATLLALIVGILALVRFYSKKENTFLFIATGFIGTSLLDGYHTFVSAPVFTQFFPSPPPSLIPWSGFASRLFLSVLLCLSWAFWRRESGQEESRPVPEHLVYLLVGTWTLACFLFFAFVRLPVGYGPLPLFHRPQEFLPVVFSLLAAAGYLRKGRWKRDPFEHWLVLSILLWVAQALYISTSDRLYDAVYIASHVLKILSYTAVFVGLTVAMFHLFLAEESIVAQRTEKLRQEIVERKRAQEQSAELLVREKRAWEKMEEERSFADAVIQSLPMISAIFNQQGKCLRWNRSFQDVLGYSAADVPNIEILDTVAEEDRKLVQRKIQEAFEQGKSAAEASLITKNGTKIPHYLTSARVLFGGQPCIAGVAVDISERKRAEEEVRLLATALESAANAIVITDPNGTIQWVNPAFTLLTGYSLEEVAGKNPRILKSGEHDAAFYKNLWNTIREGKNWTGEITNRKKDGNLYIDQTTIAPVVSAGGEITNFVAIKQDATHRKRMEAEMISSKELAEAANRAKSEFLANMSHELRTPLNGILGMLELALDTELNSEQREFLSLGKSSADSLLSLINDILDFSKIEAGRLEFESIEFDIRNTLETALKVLAPRAHEKGLELNCHVPTEVPAMLVGDPGRLRQVIVNLVGNAIKFTEVGEVTVDVALQSSENHSAVLYVTVTDTGIGIPAERQQLIFDAFAQGDGSTTRRYGGSGLGLTVSRRLVEMFQGRLWLESAVGKGSTFHFTVQVGIGSGPRWGAPLPPANLANVPVLVVDDNFTSRRILGELLARWHMKPTLTENGAAGLAHLRRAADACLPFPLVLVDSKMPEMDGFTFIEQTKQDPRLTTSAIMMLTSAGQRGDAGRCRELGVAAYLTKPIGQAELLSAIRQVLGTKAENADPSSILVTRHSMRERKLGLRILLAEDNLVNRTFAVRLLERHGYLVETACDGNEAVRKLLLESFDLVLMDVQMPGMDGFQVTAAIREKEKTRGGHLPVIAMTAHALKGDRERCLTAGMDGYVSKPFRIEDLISEIEALPSVPHDNLAWQRDQALPYVNGNTDLLDELLRVFMAEWPETKRRLHQACEQRDPAALAGVSHMLKGELPCLGCAEAGALAGKIEALLRGDQWDAAQPELARLEANLEALVKQWGEATDQHAAPRRP